MQTRTKKAERVPELFKALAEPQRIAIVRLVHEQELPAGEIADHFGTTRQAISQHLRLMTNAGLLEVRCVGTKRLYKIRQDAFRELRSFLEVFWGNHLSAPKQPSNWTRRVVGKMDVDPIVIEIFINALPEEVFPYLISRDKYLLRMGVSAELDPRPGRYFRSRS